MTLDKSLKLRIAAAIGVASLAAGAGGYFLAEQTSAAPSGAAAKDGRKILYWYDPMVPTEHYDNPDTLSSMGMKTIPKYADEDGNSAPGVKIDPRVMQNLGIRTATAQMGTLRSSIDVTGTIDFNQRDVAVIQARSGGFVQRTYGRAPSDLVRRGAPIADLLVPEWGGAQAEYLALRRAGNQSLAAAARERLKLLGMPEGLIARVDRTGSEQNVVTISTPVSGVIQTLDVRSGMTLAAGQTLAQVNGLGTVWLNAAVPEAQAGQIRVGETAAADVASYPGERFTGRVIAVLPTAAEASRTLTVRIELANRGGRLKPGMFATVHLGQSGEPHLLVPSEAVIRTGKRDIVMLATGNGRFQPAEVKLGREGGGQTEILDGLAAGEKVVASGQFLVDSEASLSNLQVRPLDASRPAPADSAKKAQDASADHSATGKIEAIKPNAITISHEPVPALQWPAMTMTFALAKPELARGFKTGDRITFHFRKQGRSQTVTSIARAGGGQ
ncbi:efflux RND transporter periplasmic adaptor subunit [Stakelama pacifica]|uniref:Cu(I)/Ag(I) efflux system membrane fusion protein n=1 Tax=Stakelama pacifica TaxID=517720 RepID=A0A4R6FVL2_9SPHN|nr:efflux RND transporter periplasmic adaptor subunit [Stakelama pacifica]TDN85330.1 Cu(I)/Ag(I) efflux system membrane fusion protein [Stakelama pacifica]GGO92957.1 hypothetical protein GCM10011329_11280 [Stakelama pacifica]